MGLGFMKRIGNFFTFDEEISEDETVLEESKSRWKGRLVSLTASRHNSIVLMEPATIKEAQEAGDHLKNRAAVLLNLQNLEREAAVRILDFTSGMAYALNGTMQKISETIFLFAPQSMTVFPPPKKVGVVKETGQLFIK